MSNPLLELIERGNASIASNQRDLNRLEAEASADDGVVDQNDEEYTEIVSIRSMLAELTRLTRTREDEFEANGNEWSGLSGDVRALDDDICTLTDWGNPDLGPINSTITEMNAAADDQRYRDAIDTFGTAQTSLAPMMEEYRRQLVAKETYENELGIILERVELFRAAEVSNDLTTSGIAQIETNLDSASAPTASNAYIEALSSLRLGSSEIARVESEIERLTDAKCLTGEQLAALMQKIAETEVLGQAFEDITPRFTVINTSVDTINAHIETCDFLTAQGVIGSTDYELDAIRTEISLLTAEAEAEAARIATERAEWERRADRWSALQMQVEELGTWADAWATDGANFVNQIQGHVDAEEFTLAESTLDQAEGSIDAPWVQHMAQVEAKMTYECTRPDLDQRFTQARTHPHIDEAATQQLTPIETTLSLMTNLETNQDYVAANDENQGVIAALDAVEQTLRENQLRAEVAEEMGIGPDASSEDVEAEVTRRLYEEERSALETRLAAVRQDNPDVIGPDIDAALSQIDVDLVSIQALADGGDTQTALDSVRTSATEMGRIDEMIRDQTELKHRYETAVANMGIHANRLATSEIETVSIAADAIINAMPDADALAISADYQGALDMVTAWEVELTDLDLQNDDATRLKTQAETALQALWSRIDAVRRNLFPEVQAAAGTIISKVEEIENLILSEAYTEALADIDVLKGLLDEFEPEAERADQYARYSRAMAVLDLEGKLVGIRECIYPETADSQTEIEAKDVERLGYEQSSDWGAASIAAYAESEMLGRFGSEVLALDGAKADYESGSVALIYQSENMFPDAPDDTGTISCYQSELSGIRARMESAASSNCFLEAVEIMAEFRVKIDEIVLAVPGLFQASDGRINGFIEGRVELAQGAVIGAISTAILRFENYIQDEVSNERGFQLAARQLGYEIDIVNAWLALIPEAGDAAAIILSIGKVAADAGAVELDNYKDAQDRLLAAELVAPLRAEALSVGSTWNSNVGQWFKANAPDVYKEVGNLLHAVNGENVSAANRVILEAGVPTAGSRPVFEEHYYQSLESQFIRQRG